MRLCLSGRENIGHLNDLSYAAPPAGVGLGELFFLELQSLETELGAAAEEEKGSIAGARSRLPAPAALP